MASKEDYSGHDYYKCYCEENIYQLLSKLASDDQWFCVVISNGNKTIPIFSKDGSHVVWDYHVIAVHKDKEGTFVYDFDAWPLEFPVKFEVWIKVCLRPEVKLNERYVRYDLKGKWRSYWRFYEGDCIGDSVATL